MSKGHYAARGKHFRWWKRTPMSLRSSSRLLLLLPGAHPLRSFVYRKMRVSLCYPRVVSLPIETRHGTLEHEKKKYMYSRGKKRHKITKPNNRFPSVSAAHSSPALCSHLMPVLHTLFDWLLERFSERLIVFLLLALGRCCSRQNTRSFDGGPTYFN